MPPRCGEEAVLNDVEVFDRRLSRIGCIATASLILACLLACAVGGNWLVHRLDTVGLRAAWDGRSATIINFSQSDVMVFGLTARAEGKTAMLKSPVLARSHGWQPEIDGRDLLWKDQLDQATPPPPAQTLQVEAVLLQRLR
jgi:hypothetical protein